MLCNVFYNYLLQMLQHFASYSSYHFYQLITFVVDAFSKFKSILIRKLLSENTGSNYLKIVLTRTV